MVRERERDYCGSRSESEREKTEIHQRVRDTIGKDTRYRNMIMATR